MAPFPRVRAPSLHRVRVAMRICPTSVPRARSLDAPVNVPPPSVGAHQMLCPELSFDNTRKADPFSGLLDALAERVAARLGDRDELVAVAAKPLAALGLELRAIQRLVADGKLRAVRIGRRVFTRRAYLLALVDELAPATAADDPEEEPDELAIAVAKAAQRRARASARKVTDARSTLPKPSCLSAGADRANA
jgi:hypothetical protein